MQSFTLRNRESMCEIREQSVKQKEHVMMSRETELQNDIADNEYTEMINSTTEVEERTQSTSINTIRYVPKVCSLKFIQVLRI